MKNFLFAAATVLLAASGSAHATVSIPDLDMRPADAFVSGPALGGANATVFDLVLSSADEAQAPLATYTGAASGNFNAFNVSLVRGSAGSDQDPNLASAISAASLPEPTSWLLAFGGFCALAAFSGRASNRDRRSRMYVPEVAMVTVARERRAI
jgi:hypothetical protein